MSSAVEVLKKYSTSCSVCKYDGGNQCKASGGEFGECKPAEELSKAINKALLALEQKEKLKEWIEKRELFLNKKREQYLKNKEPFKSRKVRDIKISKILLKEIKELL